MDSQKQNAETAELLPFLIMHGQKRDAALGLPGRRTLSLASYRRRRQREAMAALGQAAFLKSIIDEARAEVKRLIGAADTPEARREALAQVELLNSLAEGAAEALRSQADVVVEEQGEDVDGRHREEQEDGGGDEEPAAEG